MKLMSNYEGKVPLIKILYVYEAIILTMVFLKLGRDKVKNFVTVLFNFGTSFKNVENVFHIIYGVNNPKEKIYCDFSCAMVCTKLSLRLPIYL